MDTAIAMTTASTSFATALDGRPQVELSQRSYMDVVLRLEAFNRSQTYKISSIDNGTVSDTVPQPRDSADRAKTVIRSQNKYALFRICLYFAF